MASQSYFNDPRAQHIAAVLENTDPAALDLWAALDELSTHTTVDSIEVPIEGVVIGPADRFSAVMNLYLVLQYGRDDEDGFSQSESFLAKVDGRLENGEPVVEHSSVDTSSFYA